MKSKYYQITKALQFCYDVIEGDFKETKEAKVFIGNTFTTDIFYHDLLFGSVKRLTHFTPIIIRFDRNNLLFGFKITKEFRIIWGILYTETVYNDVETIIDSLGENVDLKTRVDIATYAYLAEILSAYHPIPNILGRIVSFIVEDCNLLEDMIMIIPVIQPLVLNGIYSISNLKNCVEHYYKYNLRELKYIDHDIISDLVNNSTFFDLNPNIVSLKFLTTVKTSKIKDALKKGIHISAYVDLNYNKVTISERQLSTSQKIIINEIFTFISQFQKLIKDIIFTNRIFYGLTSKYNIGYDTIFTRNTVKQINELIKSTNMLKNI